MRTKATKFTDFITAEKMLGHGLTGVHKIYDRDDYMEQMELAYIEWENQLLMLAA